MTSPLPFIELLTPFGQAAQQQLEAQCNPTDWLTPPAYQTLQRALLVQLARLAAPVLQLHFTAFRLTHQDLRSTEANNALYLAFIQAMQQGRFAALLADYRVLNRLMATTVDTWVTTTAEFLHRLAADQTDLAETFQQRKHLTPSPLDVGGIKGGRPRADHVALGPITALQPALSDPHHGGRTVWAVTFANGLQLIYKPRSLAPEQFYYDLITHLATQNLPLHLQPLPMLTRPDYGWVQRALPAPCPDEAGIKRYYQRAGLVLALFYLLQGTDGHHENLIAVGEQPIMVDLETLFHPITTWGAAAKTTPYSVMDTGLLPRQPLSAFKLETSGLGGQSGQTNPWLQPMWQAINTDAMEVMKEMLPLAPAHNLPMYQGQAQSARRYVAEIEHGFTIMYRFWQQHQPELNAWVAHRAHELPVRFLARPTEFYSALLHQSLQPKYLHDEATWRANFDWLTRRAHLLPLAVQPIIAAEQYALSQLDMPYFSAIGMDLQADNGVIIHNCFQLSGFEAVMHRLNHLSETDLQQQLSLIRQALAISPPRLI
jgi:type 2 lantibiotic biosynthesis protein LanM